jgi:hypothetical protein
MEITKEQREQVERIKKEGCGFIGDTKNCYLYKFYDKTCARCGMVGTLNAAKQFLIDNPEIKSPDEITQECLKCIYFNKPYCEACRTLKLFDKTIECVDNDFKFRVLKNCESCGNDSDNCFEIVGRCNISNGYQKWTPKQERRDCSNCDTLQKKAHKAGCEYKHFEEYSKYGTFAEGFKIGYKQGQEDKE